jgi:EAL domain-containing protein (putative c-di-GMP-specific phosphodiesterase class I)/CheY-like chemotaxis protein
MRSAKSPERGRVTSGYLGQKCALVVDDSIVQRDHAVALCSALGFATVHTASNGREAIALLSALAPPPDLLILDLEMPTMDGSQMLQHLKQNGIDIPILVASSRELSLLELVREMGSVLGLNIIGAMQKPLTLGELEKVLHKSPNNARPAREASSRQAAVSAADLAVALERGEIRVHYQPKVNMRTAVVCGVEALARWEHPCLGFVPPSEFIPLAEQHDLIHDLTMRVMSEVMLQSASWMGHGVHLSVAVNLSPCLLRRPDLPEQIRSLQEAHGVPPGKIVLELTESSLVGDQSVVLGVLARLRLRGFGLSIDDYGTGFSSLQQLTRVPFTELKIDRSFVHQASQRANLRVILHSALELAERLGITAVAEGVETLEDWRLLQELGCVVGQGYLIARPMPGDDLIAWLKEYRGRRQELMPPAAEFENING